MKKLLMLSIAACALLSGVVFAQTQTTNKKVTVVSARSTADGSSSITERPLEECIVFLPSPRDLVADVTAKSEYLKEINGEVGRDGHTKMYSAVVSVSFKLRQKFILIVTTSSIEGQEPVMKEQVREVMMTQSFASDPGDGDIFAGRSNRKYYYSTPEAAENNAKKRAETWLKQQQPTLCTVGTGK
jgi:hypothetical protein